MGGKRGFTLIELLVVVAIITLLAGILFPVFARSREGARKTTCVSNCGQLGKAVLLYAPDFDERFPTAESFGEERHPRGNQSREQVAVKAMEALLHPSDIVVRLCSLPVLIHQCKPVVRVRRPHVVEVPRDAIGPGGDRSIKLPANIIEIGAAKPQMPDRKNGVP